jgi:hypothetical protein
MAVPLHLRTGRNTVAAVLSLLKKAHILGRASLREIRATSRLHARIGARCPITHNISWDVGHLIKARHCASEVHVCGYTTVAIHGRTSAAVFSTPKSTCFQTHWNLTSF